MADKGIVGAGTVLHLYCEVPISISSTHKGLLRNFGLKSPVWKISCLEVLWGRKGRDFEFKIGKIRAYSFGSKGATVVRLAAS